MVHTAIASAAKQAAAHTTGTIENPSNFCSWKNDAAPMRTEGAHSAGASHGAVCSLNNRGAAEAIGSSSVWCGLRATQENTLRVLQACGLTPLCPSSWPLLIGESGYTCFGILSWKAARCYGIFCATATAAVVSPDSSVISSWLPSSHVPLSACLMKRLRGNDTQAICTTS